MICLIVIYDQLIVKNRENYRLSFYFRREAHIKICKIEAKSVKFLNKAG